MLLCGWPVKLVLLVYLELKGSFQEALTDGYNDELRRLMEANQLGDDDVKQLIKTMRDAERIPEGSSLPPTLTSWDSLRNASPEAVLGSVCRLVVRYTAVAAAKV